jgi:hypothetical protein
VVVTPAVPCPPVAPVVAEPQRVWVPAVYRTVCDHVWHEAEYRAVCEKVFVPEVWDVREIRHRDGLRVRERVLVRPAHYEDRQCQQLICAGHFEDVQRQELESGCLPSSISISLSSPRSGLRTPCSQLCTNLVETFSVAAKTDCDIFSFFRNAMTFARFAGGGGAGSVVAFRVSSPRTFASVSSRPALICSNADISIIYSTVTLLAKFLGLSTLQPRATAAW